MTVWCVPPRQKLHCELPWDCAACVGSYLSTADITVAEIARAFEPAVFDFLWRGIAVAAAAKVSPWGWAARNTVSQPMVHRKGAGLLAKELLRDIRKLRSSFAIVSDTYLSGIDTLSFSCLRVSPPARDLDSPMEVSEHWESREPDESQEDVRQVSGTDAVHLAIGAFLGQALGVGVHMVCKVGCIKESCCLRIEATDHKRESGCRMSIAFAPFTGRCLLKYADCPLVQFANVLPPLSSGEGQACGEAVDVWVKVATNGDILFLRRGPDGPLEQSGLFPHEALPRSVKEFHAAIEVRNTELVGPATVSITHAGAELPPLLLGEGLSSMDFCATWYMEGDHQ